MAAKILAPGQLGVKCLKTVLRFHQAIDPRIAPIIPDEIWEEIAARLVVLKGRIDQFLAAREVEEGRRS